MSVVVEILGRDRTRQATSSAEKGFRNFSSSLQKLSAADVIALGGITFAIQKATNAMGSFDTRIREIGTLLGTVTDDDIKQMGDEVQSLSIRFGQSIDSMAKARYDAISAGFTDIADSAMLIETASKLAVGGVSDVAKTTDVLTSVLNAYGLKASEANRISDILFTTVRLGKTTIDQLSAGFGTAAAIAPTLGLSVEEVAASIATLTAQGLSTDEAITALNATMTALLSPSDNLNETLEQFGFTSGAAAVKAKGFTEVLRLVTAGADEADLAALFPNVRAMRAVFPLVGDASDKFAANLAAMNTTAGATDEAFAKIAEGPGFKLQQTMARLETVTIKVGEALLPIVNVAIDALEAFTNLNTGTQQTVILMGGAGVALKALIPAVIGLGSAVRGLFASMGPAGWLVIGLGLVAQGFVENEIKAAAAREEFEKFRATLNDFNLEQLNLQLSQSDKAIDEVRATISKLKEESKEAFSSGAGGTLGINAGEIRIARELSDATAELTKLEAERAEILSKITQINIKEFNEGLSELSVDELNAELAGVQENMLSAANTLNGLVKQTEQFGEATLAPAAAAVREEIIALAEQEKIIRDLIAEKLKAKPTGGSDTPVSVPILPFLDLTALDEQINQALAIDDAYTEEYANNAAERALQAATAEQNFFNFRNNLLLSQAEQERLALENSLAAIDENWQQRTELAELYTQAMAEIEEREQQRRIAMLQQKSNEAFGILNNLGQQRKRLIQQETQEEANAAKKRFEIRKSEIIRKNTIGGKLTEQGKNLLEQLEANHQSVINQIQDRGRQREESELKKFKFIKIAQAISNTALAVTKALSFGFPPINYALAAAVGAAGAAQVSLIRAQPYQTGGVVQGTPINSEIVSFVPKGTDRIPAILTAGEAVIPRDIVSNNRPLISSLLSGTTPRETLTGGPGAISGQGSIDTPFAGESIVGDSNRSGGANQGGATNIVNLSFTVNDENAVGRIMNSPEFQENFGDLVNNGILRLEVNGQEVEAIK